VSEPISEKNVMKEVRDLAPEACSVVKGTGGRDKKGSHITGRGLLPKSGGGDRNLASSLGGRCKESRD